MDFINDSEQFRKDIKTVRDVMVYASGTNSYFKTTKMEALIESKRTEIRYYITDKVFVNKRNVIVII